MTTFESRYNTEDSQLIADLHRLSKRSPKLVRSTVYTAPSDPTVKIRSWRMNEFKYHDIPSPFPTLARGLFSRELNSEESGAGESSGKHAVVARGYDKFFNIGEVPWTDWSCLDAHTGPNYTLSVKSNGCIIFIAAISASKLVVTSKHALGPSDGVPETHSQAGHRWLKIHLASKEKSEEQLAAVLWEKNWTAVAELCDDEFEEHVLPYPPEKSGLYLHGINETCAEFHTLSTHIVDAFAEEWGLRNTVTVTCNTLAQVKTFTDKVAETGEWKGEPVEGFVVRTSIIDPKPGTAHHDKRPPYPSGSSFFFKVKFDEPYMMYRDWREVTKLLLTKDLHDAQLPKSKMKRKETRAYVKWLRNEININRSAFAGYMQGKGIIATRDQFLRWLDTDHGKAELSGAEEPDTAAKEFGKTVIVPVAIPGCGKTSISVALAHLFGFGHTQSDDVQAKKPGPTFIRNVVNLLKEHNVVIADKNNHIRQHRQALREAVSEMEPPVRLLAIHWALDQPRATLLRVCGGRIFDRGDKHQTLQADKVGKSHEDVVWQFIQQAEELADSEVDATIEMNVGDSFEVALTRAVDGCIDILGLPRPSQEKMGEAMAIVNDYVPTKKKAENKKQKKTGELPSPRYFGILVELDIEACITSFMEQAEDVAYAGKAFWQKLVDAQRITDRPHVTIVHKASLPTAAVLWERCSTLDLLPSPPIFVFSLGNLIWNERVMALTVEDVELAPESNGDPGQEKHEFISILPAEVRDGLHITVGTASDDIPPYEAKGLVVVWRSGERTGIGSLELEGLSAKGRIRGLMS